MMAIDPSPNVCLTNHFFCNCLFGFCFRSSPLSCNMDFFLYLHNNTHFISCIAPERNDAKILNTSTQGK